MNPPTETFQNPTILLEEAVPYDRSLKWEIHRRYFQERGGKAWLNGEVPYNITCNAAAARQNASLVHATAEAMEQEGTLTSSIPIRVLEIASGLGLFAINFIQAFLDLDRAKGTDYGKRLKYFFTDFSEKNLTDAAENPVLRDLHARGALDFCVLNAMTSDVFRPLTGSKEESVPPLTAVIANYLHCCLPMSVIRKEGDHLSEKHIQLSLLVPFDIPDREGYARTFVEHPVGERITENLREEVIWKDLPRKFFDHPLHEEVIREGAAEYPIATIAYPRGSFSSIERSLPVLLPGGIIVISDKGYADTSYMEGERTCEPSIHGNSIAHSVNFPLLDLLAKKLQCSTTRTSNSQYSLQTLLVEKRPKHFLSALFRHLFLDKNENMESSDYLYAARKFEDAGQFPEAIRFYERASKLRPSDASIHYRIGSCACEEREYARALKAFEAGRTFDHFNEYDFAFKIGYVLHSLGRYGEAILHYRASQEREPSEITLYDIGLCLENLRDTKNAIKHYREALERNPQYETARSALERLTKRGREERSVPSP
jgi:hypothetical protein